ncbi:MAG: hypothetical protein H6700_06190 [Myxococcales bacterium]|nr:hypothetical protein [Myxococcales bacterium]
MRNAVEVMLNALDREAGGVAIIWCPDFGLRDWLVGQVESLVSEEARPVRLSDVEAALTEPERLVLLVPHNEREVVLDLDGSRDRTLENPRRSQPIVLFLLRGGDGAHALAADAPSLRSWVSGSDPDPEALAEAPSEVDLDTERQKFFARTHRTPEEWLRNWRAANVVRNAENYSLAVLADFLVRP